MIMYKLANGNRYPKKYMNSLQSRYFLGYLICLKLFRVAYNRTS
jgi:hypothetical protein